MALLIYLSDFMCSLAIRCPSRGLRRN